MNTLEDVELVIQATVTIDGQLLCFTKRTHQILTSIG